MRPTHRSAMGQEALPKVQEALPRSDRDWEALPEVR